MKRLFPLIGFFLAAAFAFAGGAKNEDRMTDDRGVLSAIAAAPLKTRNWHNPYEGYADALLAGKKLYLQHCAECHGSNARGLGHAVNLHSPGVQNATSGELVWFLANGNLAAGMPSWSRMPVERRWQIVTYLKSFRR
jgi:mono/diheme cytochrome c family protein